MRVYFAAVVVILFIIIVIIVNFTLRSLKLLFFSPFLFVHVLFILVQRSFFFFSFCSVLYSHSLDTCIFVIGSQLAL